MKRVVKKSFLLLILCSFVLLLVNFVSANIIINEIMYHPDQCDEDYCEWIEIYNNGTSQVDLTNWTLCGDSLSKGYIHTNGSTLLDTTFILNISSYALITDGISGTGVYDNFSVNTNSLALNVDAASLCGQLTNTGKVINISNGTYTQSINYAPFVTLFPDTNGNNKTLIWYNNNWTESAYENGTPGASNDQFAPVLNEWVMPPINNTNISGTYNITVNITDVGTVNATLINFNGTNYPATNYLDFWYYEWNTTQNADGTYNMTVYFNDSLNNQGSDTIYNITVDNNGPDFFSLARDPTTSYNNDSVMFNATINDTVNLVSSVWLSGNWTGSWANYTITSILNQTYNHTVSAASFQNQEWVGYKWYANDTFGNLANSSLQSFQVSNRPPVFNTSNQVQNISIPEDGVEYRNLSNAFYDLDFDDLNYSAVNTENISVSINNETAMATITPNSGWSGDGWIVFYAWDFAGGSNQSNNVTVSVTPLTNHDPVFSTIPNINLSEDSSYSALDLSSYCSDSDPNQKCTNYQLYSLSDNNITITVNSETGAVFINATTPDWYGTAAARFLVQDNYTGTGGAGSDLSNSVLINITPVNDAPVINYSAGTWNQTKDEDSVSWTLDLTIFEADVDVGDTGTNLTWSIGNINTSLINITLNATTDIINFTVIPNAHGTNLLELNLTDDDNAKASGTLLVTINSVNDLPFINATIGPFSVLDNAVTSFDLTGKANDDNDTGTSDLDWDVIDENSSLWVYAGDASGQSIQFIPNVITGINNITDTVTVVVKDADNTNDTVSVSVTIVPVNDAPSAVSLASPANNSNQTSATGQFTLDWSDSVDPENQTLAYYIFLGNISSPPLNSTASQSQLTTGSLAGNTTYYWYIIAGDGINNATQSATWQFTTDFDHAPNITSYQPASSAITIQENQTLIFNATVYDIDGNVITYNWTVDSIQKSAGTTTDNNENVTYSYTPLFNESGTHTVQLSIIDVNSNAGTPQSWTVTVGDVNRKPALDSISDKNVNEDSALEFNVTAYDPDNNSLTFTSNITSITFTDSANNSLATASWTPTNSYVGSNTINITVSDGSLTDSQLVTITVANTNDAPSITSYFPTNLNPRIAASTGSQLFNVTPSDPDASDTTSTTWLRDNVIVGTGNSYTASSLAAGQYNITARVNDTSGSSTQNEWTLNATTNIISGSYSGSILDHNITEENASDISVNESAYGSIGFLATVNLSNAANIDDYINISNGVISINTNALQGLNRSASVIMKGLNFTKVPLIYYNDGFNLVSGGTICNAETTPSCTNIIYDSTTGILKFNVEHFSTYYTGTNTTNGAPYITSTPETSATAREAYSYDVNAADPDGDTLTYSLTLFPSGMSISSSTGEISWTPANSQVGMHNITAQVSDGNLTDIQSFNISVAEAKKLRIKSLDVKVNSKSDKGVTDEDTIKKEAEPESEIEFEVEVESGFEDEDDIKIEDIVVEVTIRDIDDGDDLDEESKEFDLRPERDKSVTLKFEAPLEVEEDTYDVDIHVEGEDENGTMHEVDWTVYLEVEKEKHNIRIIKASLSPAIVKCQKTASLATEILNLGREDEDEVVLEITSPGLISFRKENIELDEGTDDDNRYSSSLKIAVPDNLGVGTYPIEIFAYYDSTRLSDTETVNLEVQECKTVKKEKEEVKTEPVVVINKTQPTPTVKPKEEVTKVTFMKSPAYTAFLALSFIIMSGLLVFVLGMVVVLMKKK